MLPGACWAGLGCHLMDVKSIVSVVGLVLGGSWMLLGGRWMYCGCCWVGVW